MSISAAAAALTDADRQRLADLRHIEARVASEVRALTLTGETPTRRRTSRRDPIVCGTERGYQAHRRRQDTTDPTWPTTGRLVTCEPCLNGHARYEAVRRLERDLRTADTTHQEKP